MEVFEMRTGEQIKEIAASILDKATKSLNRVAEVHQSKVTGYTGNDIDSLLELSTKIMAIIGDSVALQREGDVALPKYLPRVSATEAGGVTIVIRSKLNAPYKYRKEEDVRFSANFIQDIGNVVIGALFDMLYIELAQDNLNALNAKIASILAEKELPIGFRFTMDENVRGDVAEIDDTMAVFNVSIVAALDKVSELGIMCQDEDEYGETIRTEAASRLVENMRAYQITPQLLKASNIPEISTMTSLPTKSKVSSVIRKAYHRNVDYLDRLKGAGIGYFMKDVQIEEDIVSVFALVAKDDEGNKSVILHPFDVKKLVNVDYDVIGG